MNAMASWLRVASLAVVALASACVNASSDTQGGEFKFDAAPPMPPVNNVISNCGSTFTDLYNDFFGPTGSASCLGNGNCHGGTDTAGTVGSGGYECAPDKDGCYKGMIAGGLIEPGNAAQTSNPESALLYAIIRKPDGTGIMPKIPASRVFSPSELKCITTWIAGGAPNN
jgi:hypothetical protein